MRFGEWLTNLLARRLAKKLPELEERLGETSSHLQELREMTERLLIAEEEVQLLSKAVAQMQDALVLVKDNLVHYVNRAFCDLYGYTENEIVGHSTIELFAGSSDEHKELGEQFKRVFRSSDGLAILEYQDKRKDGSVFWASTTAGIVSTQQGLYWVSTIRDITLRKRAEAELRKHRDHLEESVKERTAELQQVNAELQIRNRISDIFLTIPDDEMYGEVLQVILEATKSEHGVFGYIDEAGNLVCPSMTRTIWDKCQIPDKTIVFPRGTWGGIWGRSLVEKKTLYSNEPFRTPEGHIPMLRALVVPIVYRGEVIGYLLVGNKVTDYHDGDVQLLETIANYIAPVLRARLQRDRARV